MDVQTTTVPGVIKFEFVKSASITSIGFVTEKETTKISSRAAYLYTYSYAIEYGRNILTSSSLGLMLTQFITFLLVYVVWNVTWKHENVGQKQQWIELRCELLTLYTQIEVQPTCLIYYVRYMFRLYDSIKENCVKYLQLASKVQDVYKCKF
jgi:hypothetical protein